MYDSRDWEREEVIAGRLDALEWAINNIDRIDDKVVKAYVLRLKQMIEEKERQLAQEEGQGIPAPLFLDRTSSEEVHVLDKTSFKEVLVGL
jgi:hypothetical protein